MFDQLKFPKSDTNYSSSYLFSYSASVTTLFLLEDIFDIASEKISSSFSYSCKRDCSSTSAYFWHFSTSLSYVSATKSSASCKYLAAEPPPFINELEALVIGESEDSLLGYLASSDPL